MKTIKLGKTGLNPSELGFGGIPIIPLSMEEGVRIVKHSYDRGITFFDTANAYANSEKKIGQALESVRDKVIIATKTGKRDGEGAARHLSYSLENLRTDYIDIYQFHNIGNAEALDQILGPKGAYEIAAKARDEGKIRFIGFSSHDIATAIKGCRTGFFSTIQFPFNFIEREPADELFKVAREEEMGIIGMKPLGGGILDKADLCFKFLQQHPYVLPIPGTSTIEEVDEIVDLYVNRQTIAENDLKEIEQLQADLGMKFCHRCGYCIPCEQGVNIPSVMGFRSTMRRFPPSVAVGMAKNVVETGEQCTECEECLEKCPYSLEIPALIKENLSVIRDFMDRHA